MPPNGNNKNTIARYNATKVTNKLPCRKIPLCLRSLSRTCILRAAKAITANGSMSNSNLGSDSQMAIKVSVKKFASISPPNPN